MAWVRYDDQFPINPKVTAVVAEDPGALSLHVLANTWSNTTKTPGYVPPHQPAVLLCDRTLGPKWAEVLVRAGLWHERGKECDDCAVEYAALANDEAKQAGWVFHNAKVYQAPARDRATPGTPADLSEKRRAAGRKGGKASAAKRGVAASQQDEASQQMPATPEATGAANVQASTVSGPSKPPNSPTLEPVLAGGMAGFAGVSKASTCSQEAVSPDPDPVPDTSASNEADSSPTGEQPPLAGLPPITNGEPARTERKPRKAKRETTPEEDAENRLINELTKVYTDNVPLSDFFACRGVVVAARKANISAEAITEGLTKLAADEDPLSKETLRRAIKGSPSWANRNNNGRRGDVPHNFLADSRAPGRDYSERL